jgi:PhnB protein
MTTATATMSVTAYLCADPASDAIDWYKRAFGATERYRLDEGGRIGHAEIEIGETVLFISDEWEEQRVRSPKRLEGTAVSFVLAVPDVDATFQRAIDEGAALERPIAEAPFGRVGWVRDPFGHRWSIYTPNPSFKPEDVR